MTHNPEQIRCFIAIELPDEAREGLARLKKELERDEHNFVKWVDPGGIHLTLKFLGNIPSKRVTEITEAMRNITENESLRLDLIQKGFVRRKKFSWDQSAKNLWQSIEKTIEIS